MLITLQCILQCCRFPLLNVVSSLFSAFKFEYEKKFENFKMPATSDVIMLLWLSWKPVRCHVIILNWKYTGHLLHIPSFMSIGCILLKIEGGPIDLHPPFMPSCNFVFFMPSRVNMETLTFQEKTTRTPQKEACKEIRIRSQ